MKIKFLYFLLLASGTVFSQDLKYEEIVNVSLVNKDELYNNVRTWALQKFKTNENIITTEDQKLGEISGIGKFDYRADKKYMGYSCVEGPIRFKFSLFFKDGRYKYIFHSFIHTGSGGPGCKRVDYGQLKLSDKAPITGKMIADDYAWNDVKEKTKDKIESILLELKNIATKKNESNTNW